MTELQITGRYGKTLSPSGVRPHDAPHWIDEIDNPYIHGVYAPTVSEMDCSELEVLSGEIPRDLYGGYFRNGPNNEFKPKGRYHWFDGDGMVHGIWFENGKARYRNRWIETRGLTKERERGESIWPGVMDKFDFTLPLGPLKDTANTDLISYRGQLLATWYESGQMYAMDPRTLESRGIEDIEGRLGIPVSAHSRVDPRSGELIYFSYGDRPPYMRYGVVKPDGGIHQIEIDLPGPRRPHDIGVTDNFSILHDFPVFIDPLYFEKSGRRVPRFHRDVPTRYGVIPRFGQSDQVRWFEFEPCYMLHVVNAWEEGDWLVMIGCRTNDPSIQPDRRDGQLAGLLAYLKLQANLYCWRMNLKTGAVSEGPLDDLNAEFPMINQWKMGQKNRYSYHQRIPYEIPETFDGLVKYDLDSGASTRWEYGPGIYGSESPFAPRPDHSFEDDGYLLTFVTDVNDWSSACLIFEAQSISDGPVAKIRIPQRVPAGFHSVWIAGDELEA